MKEYCAYLDGKKVLVTGGAGFIGGSFVRKLLRYSNSNILNLDKIGYASDLSGIKEILKQNPASSDRYSFKKINLVDYDIISEIINSFCPDYIFHFAAESHVDRSIDNPRNFIDNNIVATFNILEAVRKYLKSISEKLKNDFRFIHISTDEVFGSLSDYGKFDEESQYNPKSPYSASKASSDHLVSAWNTTYEIPTIITNCSNNYGPWQFPEKLIPITILKALNNESIPLYGDGSNVRDWLFIDDHIRAILSAGEYAVSGSRFCFGGSCEVTNKKLVLTICDLLLELNAIHTNCEDLISYVDDRPGHDYRYAINFDHAKSALRWEPIVDFKYGLRKTITWYIKNREWCKKMQINSNYNGERLGLIEEK